MSMFVSFVVCLAAAGQRRIEEITAAFFYPPNCTVMAIEFSLIDVNAGSSSGSLILRGENITKIALHSSLQYSTSLVLTENQMEGRETDRE